MKALRIKKLFCCNLLPKKRYLFFCFLLVAVFTSGCHPKDNAFRIPKFIPTTCVISNINCGLF